MKELSGLATLAALRGSLPDATAPVHRNDALEREIERDPEGTASYLVYADALEAAGDARGRWIALHAARAERPDDASLGDAITASRSSRRSRARTSR